MPVKLTVKDKRMLDGHQGEAARLAMSVLVRMAEVYEAPEMMDVTQAHIDGCGLLSDAGIEFAETLASRGGKVSIPTTLNMGPLDLQNWRRFNIPKDFAEKAIRQGKAYTDMGCIPTWTCAPYQGYLTPRFGQQIAWGESNAIAYANSVLGARTNRYGDYIDICAAIAGRVPACGLHLTENRKGQVLFRLKNIPDEMMRDETFFAELGHLTGPPAGDKVPVIEGLPPTATDDQLKAFCAAAASAGAVALFHAVGVTPEAKTLSDAFHGGKPERVIDVSETDILEARADLSQASDGTDLDVVLLGCPHFSFAEFKRLIDLIDGTQGTLHDNVRFIVITSRQAHSLAESSGMLKPLLDFGVEVSLDTCAFHTPMIDTKANVLMTNSGKCAYYAPGELGVRVAFGTLADCVRSAVMGSVRREEESSCPDN